MKRAIYSTLFIFCVLAFANAQETDPKATEVWEPVPEKVVPGAYQYSSAPSDAVVLFDGTDQNLYLANPETCFAALSCGILCPFNVSSFLIFIF